MNKDNEGSEDVDEEVTEDEKEIIAEIAAKSRQPFDQDNSTIDMRKKRVSDLKSNSRVILPKPLDAKREAFIAVRKEQWLKVFREFIAEKAPEGKQNDNLTKKQKVGLAKLKKRIKDGEIVVLQTDKSGKLCITTLENYIKMGEEHTRGDKKVDAKKIEEIEREVNGHTSMWNKILNLGKDWNQEGRFRESTISKSKNVAVLTLLPKDHKNIDPVSGLPKTRPVHTANTGLDAALIVTLLVILCTLSLIKEMIPMK